MKFNPVKKAFVRAKHFVAEQMFERRYGVQTSGNLILEAHDADNICYTPMNWRQLRWALPADSITNKDVFLDIGSGKGRAVLMAALDFYFARVIGVELVRGLHEIAQRNIESTRSRLRSQKVELVCADMRNYKIPDDVTVIYMNNPVRGPIFNCVLSSLSASIKRNPRRIRFIYYNPVEDEALLATGEWHKVRTIAPWGRRSNWPYGTTCVYECSFNSGSTGTRG